MTIRSPVPGGIVKKFSNAQKCLFSKQPLLKGKSWWYLHIRIKWSIYHCLKAPPGRWIVCTGPTAVVGVPLISRNCSMAYFGPTLCLSLLHSPPSPLPVVIQIYRYNSLTVDRFLCGFIKVTLTLVIGYQCCCSHEGSQAAQVQRRRGSNFDLT